MTERTNTRHAPRTRPSEPICLLELPPPRLRPTVALSSRTTLYRRLPQRARILALCATCCAICLTFGASLARADYGNRADVRAYIDTLVKKHDFNRDALNKLFARVKKQTRVLDIIQRPYEALPFAEYRDKLITAARIEKGAQFWREHADALRRIEAKYRIPPEILLAIVGVETQYGKTLGNFPPIDTLVTLGFDYPRRAEFFRGELENLLLLAREDDINITRIKGSYAGALGIGQFIPSSYRAYAVDGNGDGKRDLWNTHDALASVANYLIRHKWQPGAPVAAQLPTTLKVPATEPDLFNRQAKPWLTRKQTRAAGISGLTPAEEPFALYSFNALAGQSESAAAQPQARNEYWITYRNFYTITRYNHSYKYALVIYQLSQAIKRRYAASP